MTTVYDVRLVGCAVYFRVREEKDCYIVHFLDERDGLIFTESYSRDSVGTYEELLYACEVLARNFYDDKTRFRGEWELEERDR